MLQVGLVAAGVVSSMLAVVAVVIVYRRGQKQSCLFIRRLRSEKLPITSPTLSVIDGSSSGGGDKGETFGLTLNAFHYPGIVDSSSQSKA